MDIEINPIALKYKDQGNTAYKAQQYSKAITLYTKAIEIQEDSSFFSNRALCYFNLNRFQECINDCDRATRMNPQLSKAFKKKSQACIQLLKFQEAVEAAKANVSIEKNVTANNELQQVESLKSNYDRYVTADRENNYSEALSCINHLVNKIPNNKTLKLYKVECLAKTGETQQANNLLNSIHNQNTPEFYYLKGIIQLYNGDSVKAKKFFADGMRLDPQNSKCQKALNKAKKCQTFKEQGNELIKQQKYKQAENKYTEALHLDPYNKKLNSIIYSNRALCFMKLGQKIKALQDLNKSLELDPNYIKSLVRRAELHMERQDYTAALHDYGKIQELDPNVNLKSKIQQAKKKEKQAKKKDYYAILGVNKNSTDAEIKKAYKALALKYHPDRNRGKSDIEQDEAAKKFKDIAEAHGVLTDPQKRKKYDCGQMEYDGDMGSGFQNMGQNMHFNMGNMGNMGNGSNVKFTFNGTDMGGMGVDPSTIFSMFFNNGGAEQFEGFGSFGGMRGGNKQKSNNRGSSKSKGFAGFPGFGGGFGNFGGFGQSGSKFNFQ